MRWMLAASLALAACATTSPEPGATTSPPRASSEPRVQLDQDDIVSSMQAIRSVVMRCFDRYKAPGLYSAGLTIGNSGRVDAVHVRGPNVDTNDCVGRAVATAMFPPFTGAPQSIVYPFVFR